MNKSFLSSFKYFAYVPFFGGEGVGILDVLIWIPIWIVGILLFLAISRLNSWMNSANEKKENEESGKKKGGSLRIF